MKLAWITNLAAPYRLPMWDAIASDHELIVGLLASTEWNRSWSDLAVSRRYFELLQSHSIRRGESTHYVLNPRYRHHTEIFDADVLVLGGWDSPAYWQIALHAKARDIPCIGFYESTLRSQRYRRGPIQYLRKRFFGSMESVIAVSRGSRQALRNIGLSDSHICEVWNGVDAQLMRAVRSRVISDGARKSHRFIYVGQLIRRKNVEALVRAFAGLDLPLETTLTLIGDGEEREQIEALCSNLRLEDRVTFLGQMPYEDVLLHMCDSHTLVLPSIEEVWGFVVSEALSLGIHAVVSESCGIAGNVEDMRGVWISGTDSVSLNRAMRASCESWEGVIEKPELLTHGARDMAAEIVRHLDASSLSVRS